MNDYIKNNFLPEDHEQADKELECFTYNTNLARMCYQIDSYERAFVRHENANRSYKVLQELRDKHDKKVTQDQLVKAYD